MLSLYLISMLSSTATSVESPAKIPKPQKVIALTFDDGPKPEVTEKILDTLEKNNSCATFFVVGENGKSSPEILRKMDSIGCEIGNHSFSHAKLTNISDVAFKQEISKTDDVIYSATGKKTTLLRPTYGAYNQHLKDISEKPLVLWSIDTEDWNHRDASKTVERVMSKVKDGSIILMHDIYPQTAHAVSILVPKLIEQGYRLVTVSQLYEYHGKSMVKGNVYGTL